MVKLKLQYDTFETGEFTEEQTVDLDQLLGIFDEHTQLVKTKRSFTINKGGISFFIQNGQNYLRIAHFAKDAFTVFYCNDPDDRLYEGRFYKKSIPHLLTLFFKGDHAAIAKIVPRTSKHEKELMKLFIKYNFIYTSYHNTVSDPLSLPIVISGISIVLIILLFFNISLFLTGVISAIAVSIPAILRIRLEKNYVGHSENKSIKISSGSDQIILTENGRQSVFDRSDIKNVIYYNVYYRSWFSEYSYAKIVLNSGSVFIIPYTIIGTDQLKYKLTKGYKSTAVTSSEIQLTYPLIK